MNTLQSLINKEFLKGRPIAANVSDYKSGNSSESQLDRVVKMMQTMFSIYDYANLQLLKGTSLYVSEDGHPQDINDVMVPVALKGLILPAFVTADGEEYNYRDVRAEKVDLGLSLKSVDEYNANFTALCKLLGKKYVVDGDYVKLGEVRKSASITEVMDRLGDKAKTRDALPIPSSCVLLREEDQEYDEEAVLKYLLDKWTKALAEKS